MIYFDKNFETPSIRRCHHAGSTKNRRFFDLASNDFSTFVRCTRRTCRPRWGTGAAPNSGSWKWPTRTRKRSLIWKSLWESNLNWKLQIKSSKLENGHWFGEVFCQPQVSFLPTILVIPQFLIKGFPQKEDPKLSFEGNKVHTLLKLFQGESSKQDSVKFEGVVFYKPPPCKIQLPQTSSNVFELSPSNHKESV